MRRQLRSPSFAMEIGAPAQLAHSSGFSNSGTSAESAAVGSKDGSEGRTGPVSTGGAGLTALRALAVSETPRDLRRRASTWEK